MGFPRQEYWSGLPFPSPGDLPDPGMETKSPALAVAEPPQKPAPLLSEAQILNVNKMLSNSNQRKYLSHFQGDGVNIYVYIYILFLGMSELNLADFLTWKQGKDLQQMGSRNNINQQSMWSLTHLQGGRGTNTLFCI